MEQGRDSCESTRLTRVWPGLSIALDVQSCTVKLRYNESLSNKVSGVMDNRSFPSCCEPHYESEAKCKTFHMKISFCLHMNEN